jgi:hypothetical protein
MWRVRKRGRKRSLLSPARLPRRKFQLVSCVSGYVVGLFVCLFASLSVCLFGRPSSHSLSVASSYRESIDSALNGIRYMWQDTHGIRRLNIRFRSQWEAFDSLCLFIYSPIIVGPSASSYSNWSGSAVGVYVGDSTRSWRVLLWSRTTFTC